MNLLTFFTTNKVTLLESYISQVDDIKLDLLYVINLNSKGSKNDKKTLIKKTLPLYSFFEKYKNMIYCLVIILFALLLIKGYIVLLGAFSFILLLLYVPIMLTSEWLKDIIILGVEHERDKIYEGKDSNKTKTKELGDINKSILIYGIEYGKYNIVSNESFNKGELEYMHNVTESVSQLYDCISNVILLVKKNNTVMQMSIIK